MPTGYVTGQETAVVHFVNAGVAAPRDPAAADQPSAASAGRPTLVSNAETLAHVALIARHGADWFRELGPADEPGSGAGHAERRRARSGRL